MVTIARGIDDVQPQTNAILLDDVRDGLDLGGGTDGLVRCDTTLGVQEMGSENRIDQSRFAQARLPCNDVYQRCLRSGWPLPVFLVKQIN